MLKITNYIKSHHYISTQNEKYKLFFQKINPKVRGIFAQRVRILNRKHSDIKRLDRENFFQNILQKKLSNKNKILISPKKRILLQK